MGTKSKDNTIKVDNSMGNRYIDITVQVMSLILKNKEKSAFIGVMIGTFFTGLGLSKHGIEFLPLLFNAGTSINVLVLVLLTTFSLLLISIAILFITDFIIFIMKGVIFVERKILKYFDYKDKSPLISKKKITGFIFGLILLLNLLIMAVFIGSIHENRTEVEFSTTYSEPTQKGKFIYDTGNAYIINSGDKTLLIPYDKIKFMNLLKK